MKLHLRVAGFETVLDITEKELSTIYRPALESLAGLAEPGRRKIAFLAGPPGSGKSTCGAVLEALGKQLFQQEITVLPMDGFHFPNAYLKTHSVERDGERILLARIKGAPESYDLVRFSQALTLLHSGRELLWPVYDRNIHDVVPDQIPIPAEGIFIVEGNYLLMDEPGWRELLAFADKRIFILESEEVLLNRLMSRHLRGGKSPEEAKEWVMRNDLANIRRVLSQRLPADIRIETSH